MDNNTISGVYLKRKSYQSLKVDDSDIQLLYVLQYIPEDHNAPILDAGCGNGKRALKLHELRYSNISAVDLFDSIPVKEISYKKASIEALPFDNNSFQFIYALSVIYYPSDPQKAIQEFARVIKPGGTLLFTAHTKYSLFTLRRVIMRLLGRKVVIHLKDVKFKTASTYIKLLKKSDFEIIRVDGFYLSYILVPFYGLIRKILKKYVGLDLPEVRNTVTKSKFMGLIKSVFAYHMVIVARKKDLIIQDH